jgi:hypothetical protein
LLHFSRLVTSCHLRSKAQRSSFLEVVQTRMHC